MLLRYQLIDTPCLLKAGRIFRLESIIKLFEVVGEITFVNDLLDKFNPARVDIVQDTDRLQFVHEGALDCIISLFSDEIAFDDPVVDIQTIFDQFPISIKNLHFVELCVLD